MNFLPDLKLSGELKKYVSNTGYMFAGKVINMLVSMAAGIYVARYLGPKDYGLLQYANSFVTLFGALATLGLNDILVRELVGDKYDENLVLGTNLFLRIGAGIATTILVICVGLLTNKDSITQYLILILSTTLIFKIADVFQYWFQARVLAKYSELSQIAGIIASSIIKILFVILQLTVIYFAIALAIAAVLRFVFLLVGYSKMNLLRNIVSFDSELAKRLLLESWPLILAGLNISIAIKIDQIMIKEMLGFQQVGIYAVAAKLVEASKFLPSIIMASIFPKLIELHGTEKFWNRTIKILKYTLWPLIVITLIVTGFSKLIIEILFGNEFIQAGNVLTIYFWTLPLTLLGILTNKYLILINKSKVIFFRQGLVTLLNIILNFLLIPILGIVGAAFASLFPLLAVNIFFDFYDHDLRKLLKAKVSALTFGVYKTT